MMRRIAVSLIGGLGITAALTLVSAIFVRLMPYRDLPMMLKPFFLFTLLPGILAAESIESHRWISASVFWIANALAYGIGVFAFDTMRRLRKSDKPIN
jgi:hypothetical protein